MSWASWSEGRHGKHDMTRDSGILWHESHTWERIWRCCLWPFLPAVRMEFGPNRLRMDVGQADSTSLCSACAQPQLVRDKRQAYIHHAAGNADSTLLCSACKAAILQERPCKEKRMRAAEIGRLC